MYKKLLIALVILLLVMHFSGYYPIQSLLQLSPPSSAPQYVSMFCLIVIISLIAYKIYINNYAQQSSFFS